MEQDECAESNAQDQDNEKEDAGATRSTIGTVRQAAGSADSAHQRRERVE